MTSTLVTLTEDGQHFNGDVRMETFDRIPTHWMPVPVAITREQYVARLRAISTDWRPGMFFDQYSSRMVVRHEGKLYLPRVPHTATDVFAADYFAEIDTAHPVAAARS